MRVDLPLCSFVNCRFNLDHNCLKKNEYNRCEHENLKKNVIPLLEKAVEEIESIYEGNTELTIEIRDKLNLF